MYQFLTKNGQTIAFGVGALIVILFYVLVYSSGDFQTFTDMDDQEVLDVKRYKFGLFDFGLWSTVILTGLAVVAALGFGIFQASTNIKGSIPALIGLGILVIIFLIGYYTGEVEQSGSVFEARNQFNVSEGEAKIINGGLYTAVALLAIAVLGLIVSEIRNFFK